MTGEKIVLPVQNWYFEWCLANNYQLQVAMAAFTGQVSYHLPSHPLLKFFQEVPVGQKQLSRESPVDGPTVFTDGSGKTGKAAVTWKVNGDWQHVIKFQTGSPQIVELRAMTTAFQLFPQAVNIVTDSTYVANLTKKLDKVVLSETDHRPLFQVLLELRNTIQQRTEPYFVLHICSHTPLPGFFTEGNAVADALVANAALTVPNRRQQAILSHQFYHQGA